MIWHKNDLQRNFFDYLGFPSNRKTLEHFDFTKSTEKALKTF